MMSEEGQCCSAPPFNTTLREKVMSSFHNNDLFSSLESVKLWNRKTTSMQSYVYLMLLKS